MTTSEQINELAMALANAQGEMDQHAESRALYAMCKSTERPGRWHQKVPIAVRLLNRVVFGATDCWHYCGARNAFGYGRITVNNKLSVAHRLSYEQFVGPIPAGMSVLHTCDNPSCINPDHLWLGTYRDNSVDAWNKRRNPLRNYLETTKGVLCADIK